MAKAHVERYSLKRWEWKDRYPQVDRDTKVNIKPIGNDRWLGRSHYRVERQCAYVADFEIEIDVPRIINECIAQAAGNHGNISRRFGGAIIVRRSNMEMTDEQVTNKPIPDGFEEVSE